MAKNTQQQPPTDPALAEAIEAVRAGKPPLLTLAQARERKASISLTANEHYRRACELEDKARVEDDYATGTWTDRDGAKQKGSVQAADGLKHRQNAAKFREQAAAAHAESVRILDASAAAEAEVVAAVVRGREALPARIVALRIVADEAARAANQWSVALAKLESACIAIEADERDLRAESERCGEQRGFPVVSAPSYARLAFDHTRLLLGAEQCPVLLPESLVISGFAHTNVTDAPRHILQVLRQGMQIPYDVNRYPEAEQVRDLLAMDGTYERRVAAFKAKDAANHEAYMAAEAKREREERARLEDAREKAGHGAPDAAIEVMQRESRKKFNMEAL